MSNEIISERGMPSMRKFMNAVRPHVEFGRKPAPEPETADEAGARRTGEVTARANAEKKSFGFLRSVAKKTFGKKETPVAEPRAERNEDERRQAVIDRAKVTEAEDDDCGQCEGTGTTQSASNGEDEECPVCDGSGKLAD